MESWSHPMDPSDQCCGSGIRCLFDPRIRDPDRFFPDPGSQTHIFESILKIFG
jgi:hypothetical protein